MVQKEGQRRFAQKVYAARPKCREALVRAVWKVRGATTRRARHSGEGGEGLERSSRRGAKGTNKKTNINRKKEDA